MPGSTLSSTTNKKAIFQKDSGSRLGDAVLSNNDAQDLAANFWSESQASRAKSRTFLLEPPPEQIKDECAFKVTQTRKSETKTSYFGYDMQISSTARKDSDRFGQAASEF